MQARGDGWAILGAVRCGVLLLLFGLLAPPAIADPPGDREQPFLQIDAPRDPQSATSVPLLEISGHGGTRRGNGHDLVIAIDVSESTLLDSGMELDDDGPEGRTDPTLLEWLKSTPGGESLATRLAVQDFDDTVLAAELAAARALVARLDPARFRVAVIAFAERARVLASFGEDRAALLRALDDLPRDLPGEAPGTNYQAAVRLAHRLLRPPKGASDDRLLHTAPGASDDRLRSIVFLSDGAPTRPLRGRRAERFALEAARAAGRDGIRLFAFAIGPEAEAGLAVLQRMAFWTSGRLETVARPGRIVSRLRRLDLVGLAQLEVTNTTTGEAARALRVFPDGSFDGFVDLAPGRNRLRFRATDQQGASHEVTRVVVRQPNTLPEVSSGLEAAHPASPAADEPLVEKLRRRTAEIEALERTLRLRRQRRELELRAEPAS